RFSGPKTSIICSPMTSLKTSIKTITYLSDTGCLEIQGASLIGHYGLGVDQHQKIDNYTMGLNSWKIAPNERGDKKGVPGLSCFQPH
ncbi:hypothetical protein, partial [Escherichia coli]